MHTGIDKFFFPCTSQYTLFLQYVSVDGDICKSRTFLMFVVIRKDVFGPGWLWKNKNKTCELLYFHSLCHKNKVQSHNYYLKLSFVK